MDVSSVLSDLRRTAPDRIAAAGTLGDLDDVAAAVMGRSSPLAGARRSLAEVAPEDRPELGRLINEADAALRALVAARRAELEESEERDRLEAERVDVTLPGRRPARGSRHLITSTIDEIVDIFVSIGYTVATGPEVETEFYNFTALNMPATHPARMMQDTLYVEYGDRPGEVLLRTHTSPMQARYMEAHDPPVYLVVPGRVFRRDALDPTHSPVFHQVEGLAVDDDITFGDLKGTLAYFAREFFGRRRAVRFLPSYFPFTEPSAEMLVECFACSGSGCRVCGQTGWIELLGCGMVNPPVFEAVGYDPEAVTGFAFGIGVDRMAQVRHAISDLRHLFESDLRVLGQFR